MATYKCGECDKDIEGESLWFNPFAVRERVDDTTLNPHGGLSSPESAGAMPFHLECLEKRFQESDPSAPEDKQIAALVVKSKVGRCLIGGTLKTERDCRSVSYEFANGRSDVRLSSKSILVALLITVSAAQQSPPTVPKDGFVSVNGIKLHYVDWGGKGEVLLFLTSFGAAAHEFDPLATHFIDRFHALGLTRRGQGLSDEPKSGYDTRTLVEDIRGFLDVKRVARVTLVGYSVAGREETLFAATYPDRVNKLVYLDATGDPKSAYELATNPVTAYPLGLNEPDGVLGQISKGAREADPDYTKVAAPALAFCVIYERSFRLMPMPHSDRRCSRATKNTESRLRNNSVNTSGATCEMDESLNFITRRITTS